ncbi:hypothetical protein A1O3_03883 [Capronia epimyces CBS 606.96]|uniref:Cyclase n=1 Tax=Capronia epimyces CBS 606.96 TaxID=1182542 RepID=W9YXB7_9EURO|nr:uncharacterized protein A1O3_03883 [Capronia epimyces CBS 606.96]EXJ86929.1 hypothetical protein A1O3_03883 [Capronia epimyces CBS 606.96]
MATWDPDSDCLPKLNELPKIPGAPEHAAWFWGPNDEVKSRAFTFIMQLSESFSSHRNPVRPQRSEIPCTNDLAPQLGRLNLLTPRRVTEAAKLIQTGERAGLNLPAEWPEPPFFGRQAFKHTVVKVRPHAFDDLYELNTQSGSQWDGFRHTTVKQIEDKSGKIGTSAWAHRGIVGRGVLIDFYDHCGKSYDPFTPRKITANEIKACAKAQGVEFHYGDIFIVRTGFSDAYRKLDERQREKLGTKAYLDLQFAGLSRAHETVELLHDNYFSAVASDAPAFETWPMDEPEHLHHWLLPLWGCPIGELWDLEELAALCKKHQRYTFFLSSSPANVKGKSSRVIARLSPGVVRRNIVANDGT